MSPITLLDSNITSPGIVYRSNWETGQQQDHMDPKAVGGHLPLGKRNSSPLGVGINMNNYNSLKAAYVQQQNQLMINASNPPSTPTLHRPLDRSYSEPVKSCQLQLTQQQLSQQQLQLQPQTQPTSSSRYKTELCRPFAETGFCKYGEKCQFAHGSVDLRDMPRHPKYKTELCRTFHTTGLCGYGTRCHFIHNAEERRNPSPLAFGVRGTSEDDVPPLPNLSPPASLHGSPTSPAGAFFGDTFSLLGSPNHSHGSGLGISTQDVPPSYSMLSLDTPPVSPVESLAGDIESLSLSPALSDSPSPPLGPPTTFSQNSALMDNARYRFLRLPIFESLKET